MADQTPDLDVAIIGGGIAGLALAWRLRQRAPELRIRLFEADERTGGKILSERIEHEAGSFLVEGGPDALLTQKPEALALIDELGMRDQLIPIAQGLPATLLRDGTPVPTPDGLRLIAPTKLWPFARSPIMSARGKLRVGLDLVWPRNAPDGDESQAAFIRRRFGREAVERLAEPIIAGIHNGDPEELSLRATFPQLVEIERKHRSVILGMRAANRARGKASSGAPFITLRDGMESLPLALSNRLADLIQCNSPIESIIRHEAGYQLRLTSGETVSARQVMLTTPAAVTARLLRDVAPDAAERIGRLRAIGAGSISLAFRTAAVKRPLPGYGLVIPSVEGRPINAVTVASRKFAGRASDGGALLRLFFGGARSKETLALDDDQLLALVHEQLRDLFGIEDAPLFHRIVRWPAGSPQYDVGHLDRVDAIEKALPRGLFVTGSPYRGVGIPDVVRGANGVAERIVKSST